MNENEIRAILQNLAPHRQIIILWIIRAYYTLEIFQQDMRVLLSIPPHAALAQALIFFLLLAASGITIHHGFPAILAIWASSVALLVISWSAVTLIKNIEGKTS